MKSEMRVKVLVAVAALLMSMLAAYAVSDGPTGQPRDRRKASTAIADTAARSAALFTELGKVLTHPRCVNCHPAGDRPRQGDEGRLHQPPVARGPDGHGLEAMRCPICHQQANFEPGRMPGHPEWHLAPREMAWEGKTLAEICAQIKDPGATAPVASETSSITSAPTRWSAGPGRRGSAAARSRHAEGSRRARRGLGQDRSDLPGLASVRCHLASCERRHEHRLRSPGERRT